MRETGLFKSKEVELMIKEKRKPLWEECKLVMTLGYKKRKERRNWFLLVSGKFLFIL